MDSIGWLLLTFILGGYAGAVLVGLMSINPRDEADRDTAPGGELEEEEVPLVA